MFTNNFDPVAFNLIFLDIRWYSLSYIFGIFFGWMYIKKYVIRKHDIKILFDNLITYIIFGVILGGRIGYVLFYDIEYYTNNIFEIIYVWNGGMSFHGGLVGVIIVTYLYSKKKEVSALVFLDYISLSAPIGLFFGRLANFVNGELIGKPTNGSWGVIFPNIDNILRHPSQLYEAFLEGIILFIILNIVFFRTQYRNGQCSYLFLIFYGFFRIFSEFFREPDIQMGYLIGQISMGMILSSFMIVIGTFAYYRLFLFK